MYAYIQKHWYGEFSLGKSFWINFFLLNLAFEAFVALLLKSDSHPISLSRILLVTIPIFLVVYIWQVVGLWRSAANHQNLAENSFWPNTVKLLVVLSILVQISQLPKSLSGGQRLLQLAFFQNNFEESVLQTYTKHNIQVIHLSGHLNTGVSNDFKKLILLNPNTKMVILDSPGGWVYEGRKLHKLIREKNLITYSLNGCYSACTVAFIAGKKRYISNNAYLGFHQYRTALDEYSSQFAEHLQKQDLKLFENRGIRRTFTKKLYQASPDNMWYPSKMELINSNVIDGVLPF